MTNQTIGNVSQLSKETSEAKEGAGHPTPPPAGLASKERPIAKDVFEPTAEDPHLQLTISAPPSSSASLTLEDGSTYIGQVIGNIPHGQGTCTFENGDKYDGNWVNGEMHGQGTYTFENRDKYDGNWVNGEMHGQGTYISVDKSSYVGELKNGKQDGQGTLTYANGDKYEGNWQDGKYHDQGIYTYADGSTYVGGWKNGEQDGQGIHTLVNGEKYNGDWVDGLKHGLGTYTSKDGTTYVGEWKDGQPDGQGTRTYARGGRYMGGWKNGQRDGQGTLTFADGTWISGSFKNDYIMANQSNLADLKFLGLLAGMSSTGDSDYSLGIMANFLEQQTREDEKAAGEALKQAEKILRAGPAAASLLVKAALQKGESQLLAYGFKRHSMGLNLSPVEEKGQKFVYCDLYNSGGGLEAYHVHVPEKGKYQTRLRVRVPLGELTHAKIQELLNYDNFPSAKEAYDAILNIPGASKIEATGDEAVLQTSQKSGNCSLEWIFAYLKHNLKNYDQMRINLFKACKEAAENTEWIPPAGHSGSVTLTPGGTSKSQGQLLNLANAKKILIQELGRKIESRSKEGGQKVKDYQGGKYIGGWKNGKPHGQGTLTLLDGTQYEGMWVNGQFQVSSKTK